MDIGAVARSCRPLLTVSFRCLLKSCLSSAITSAHLKQTSQQSTLKKRLPALPKVEMSFQSLPSVSNFQTSFRLFEFSIQTLILSLVNFVQDLDLSINFCKEEKGRTVSTNTLPCKFYDVTCSIWKRDLSTQFRIPRIPQSYFLVDVPYFKMW